LEKEKFTMLKITNLYSFYGKARVLHDVNLKIGEGQFVTLLGPNGAGKTTTMMSVSGLVTLSEDTRIEMQGNEIHKMSSHDIVKLGIIHVPQGRGVFPGLTMRENLLMGAYMNKSRKQAELDIEEVIDLFPRLKDRLAQQAGTLSGGEQQMMAIMRGLMAHPKLLMLDEPSMGLAPIIVEQIYEKILEINKKGMTIFLVEQNAGIALNVAEYAYILSSGTIVREGWARELSHENLLDYYFQG
jgi:branched-chain amino acid transport system ATP-binding protein